ncbi:hypothetical protein H9Q72_013615 [Fusarium xylarioides]|uniref:chitinase n=1 Tax=Fusarium xylarioides TaxID=221167 RepID=A0A9P7HJQ7_9HYPO|nr:hypothetical protein H9Q72_013615 [Fusarium xylarioides]
MHLALLLGLGAAVVVNAAKSRNVLYFDQWHTTDLPPQELTRAVTHIMISFANSSLFATQPAEEYKPFQSLKQVRDLFDQKVKVCLSIGGWGDNLGFDEGVKTSLSRERFAKNIASTVNRLGFDCVDVDWEYPGGNSQDYKQVPNCNKTSEIKAFPMLLKKIKNSIGSKELSIAVPGLERDMIAYSDTGKSGSMTFKAANFAARPAKLTTTPDNTCGVGTSFRCAEGSCCRGSGWCGSTTAYCGTGCQFTYGKCDGIDISSSFHKALKNGYTDEDKGAQWYWDAETHIFWSWETPELIQKKDFVSSRHIWYQKCYGLGARAGQQRLEPSQGHAERLSVRKLGGCFQRDNPNFTTIAKYQ